MIFISRVTFLMYLLSLIFLKFPKNIKRLYILYDISAFFYVLDNTNEQFQILYFSFLAILCITNIILGFIFYYNIKYVLRLTCFLSSFFVIILLKYIESKELKNGIFITFSFFHILAAKE